MDDLNAKIEELLARHSRQEADHGHDPESNEDFAASAIALAPTLARKVIALRVADRASVEEIKLLRAKVAAQDAQHAERELALAAEIEALQGETEAERRTNEYLQAMLDGRWKDAAVAYLQSAGPDGKGGFQFNIQATIVPLIAEHLAAAFKAQGGKNFVEMEVTHDELGPLVLTMQRRHGELCGKLLAAERARVAALREALAPFAEIAPSSAFSTDGSEVESYTVCTDPMTPREAMT